MHNRSEMGKTVESVGAMITSISTGSDAAERCTRKPCVENHVVDSDTSTICIFENYSSDLAVEQRIFPYLPVAQLTLLDLLFVVAKDIHCQGLPLSNVLLVALVFEQVAGRHLLFCCSVGTSEIAFYNWTDRSKYLIL
jgi:hypothetical protein